MKIAVVSVNYQRNGIAGEGFFAVRFDWKDERGAIRQMIATVFPEYNDDGVTIVGSEYYGVVDINEPTACWRGDNFIGSLLDAIIEHQRA